MSKLKIIGVLCCAAVLVCAAPGFGVNVYISGLSPNWEQPYDYPDPLPFDASGPGPDPNQANPDPWDAWCTPTAAAMMMGHWADVKGDANTGDASADGRHVPAAGYGGAAWPAVSWHDYTADATAGRPGQVAYPTGIQTGLGWYMNTNNFGCNNLITNPGVAHVGTYVGNTHEGINNFLSDRGSSLAGSASTAYVNPAVGGIGFNQVITMIKGEIDANRTVLGHFKWWVNPQLGGPAGPGNGDGSENGEGDYESTGGYGDYVFDQYSSQIPGDEEYNEADGEEGLGHTVCIVGYTADAAGALTHLIAHDNWPVTVRNVHVAVNGAPLNAITTLVPEPATLALLLIGGFVLLGRKRN